MSTSETTEATRDVSSANKVKFEHSVLLKLPKFSKGYQARDFLTALESYIERCDIKVLGRLKYPNEWNLTLSSKDARERLLQASCITVKGKKCVIHPLTEGEIRGKIHWLPGELDDSKILEMLNRFGEVISFEKDMVFRTPAELRSSVRSFSLLIKPSVKKEDIPHFIHVNKYEGLVTIKDRDPICLGCKELGHKKSKCPKTASKLPKKNPEKNSKVTANNKKRSRRSKSKAEGTATGTAETNVSTNDRTAVRAASNKENNLEESINDFIQKVSDTLHRLGAVAGASSSSGEHATELNAVMETVKLLNEDEVGSSASPIQQETKGKKKKSGASASVTFKEPIDNKQSVSQQNEHMAVAHLTVEPEEASRSIVEETKSTSNDIPLQKSGNKKRKKKKNKQQIA